METWRPVPSYEGLYEVSDWGRVRSLSRVVTVRTGVQRVYQGRMLKVCRDDRHRRWVYLNRDGRQRPVKVSHLVLFAFVGPRPPGTECCHRDDDPANNTLGNLRWDTRAANLADRVPLGVREFCKRRHLLAGPNLYASALARGIRTCASCHAASSYISYRKGQGLPYPSLAAEADRRYMALSMESWLGHSA